MDIWYYFLNQLDSIHPDIENIVFCVVGLAFFVLYALGFYKLGRRRR